MSDIIKEPFNGDTQMEKYFSAIIEKYKPNLIIETGTFYGYTTEFFAKTGIDVITIEISEQYYQLSKQILDKYPNVEVIHNNSINGLNMSLFKIKNKRVFMFLDAHWENDQALERELEFCINNGLRPLIAIHDFAVPKHPEFGFDTYGGKAYNFQNYKKYFDKIYGVDNYYYLYNDVCSGKIKRGVIFLIPNN